MFRKRKRVGNARPSRTELHRAAAVREFTDRGWPQSTAALTALAMHPFDDGVEPVNGSWEDRTRRASMAFWMQMRLLENPESVASLARHALTGYRETAIAAGDPYYARRYDTTLEQSA
ncbi:MAG TPA: hypothetical protein VG078_06085 [Acidimicrobiales bacterium]|nr:hypothetical protein [Acidimicrobiales bacterium]